MCDNRAAATFQQRKKTMNRQELIAAVADKTGVTKVDADKVLKAVIEVVTETVAKGDKVQLVGFGTFERTERAAREGRNPRTGEVVKIAACKAPKFTAGAAFKDAVNA
ncbi:HU family DNA-binding protein [Parasutterella sp.]|uniref:HU family DNA-binding protein n=1 Tax=Parasutterella sp. TaxID=2049037 RepID=UPI0025FDB599|nr:HU family DNA-binding protein [Parasutterella sp.]